MKLSTDENKLDERIKIFDPIMNKLKDKADFIRNKGKYTKLGKYFEYIISDSIKNIKKFNYFYVGDDVDGENLKRQVPKLRKSLGNYSSLKVNLSGSDESKLKKYLYDSFRDGILDGRGEDMDREDVDFYIAHWLMDNGFTTPYVFGERKSVKEQLTFQQFQDKSAELNKKTSELGKVLNSFPKGEMGMVKQTPEVKKIKKEFDIVFKELQNLNKKYVKIYKKELQKARADKRMKRQTKESVNESTYKFKVNVTGLDEIDAEFVRAGIDSEPDFNNMTIKVDGNKYGYRRRAKIEKIVKRHNGKLVKESVNEAMDNIDKVLYFIKKEIKRGYLNRLKVDEDEIIAIASKYKIRLNDDEVDEIISMIDTEDNIFESVNEISWAEMERIDAIQKDIKSHIAKNYKDEIKQKKDRWMKSYSDLVGHSGKGLNKKNLKNIVKLAKQKNDKKLLQMVTSLSKPVKESQLQEISPFSVYARDQNLFRSTRYSPKTIISQTQAIAGLVGMGADVTVVDDFIKKNNIDAKKLRSFLIKLKYDDRLKFIKTFKSAVTGKPNNKEFKMITKQFSESVNEARMKEDDFIDRLEDYAYKVIPSKDYIKKSTRDLLKQLIGSMRTDKKAKALYTYWSKNKGKDLLDKMGSLFESVNIENLIDTDKITTVKQLQNELEKIVKEEQLDEKLITFSNRAPYGQIVFMAGGAGSGKGFAISNFIDSAGFKVRDVDEMKTAVGKLDQLGKFSVDKWYKKFSGNLSADARKHVEEFVIGKGLSIADISNDLKNPNNVAALHFIVDAMGIKDKWLISMLKGKKNKETLPNLLFDITAKKVGSITSVIKPLLANGYDAKNIHLIWVLTDYHVAVSQNKERERVVPDDILLKTHEGAAKTIWDILTKALPSGLNGRIDVILNNRENTVTYKDADGDTLKGAIKGFLSLPIKKQGGGILPEKIWLNKLYKWVSDNGPKTVDLQKPLDAQLESVNENKLSVVDNKPNTPKIQMTLDIWNQDESKWDGYSVSSMDILEPAKFRKKHEKFQKEIERELSKGNVNYDLRVKEDLSENIQLIFVVNRKDKKKVYNILNKLSKKYDFTDNSELFIYGLLSSLKKGN